MGTQYCRLTSGDKKLAPRGLGWLPRALDSRRPGVLVGSVGSVVRKHILRLNSEIKLFKKVGLHLCKFCGFVKRSPKVGDWQIGKMKEADHRQFWFRNNKFDLFYEKVPSLAANCDLDYHHRHRNAVSVYRKEPDGRARPVGPDSWLNRGWLVRLGSIYSKLPVKCPRQAAGSPPATRSLTWHSIRERCKMKELYWVEANIFEAPPNLWHNFSLKFYF